MGILLEKKPIYAAVQCRPIIILMGRLLSQWLVSKL